MNSGAFSNNQLNFNRPSLQSFDLFIFDWDGVLVDSLGAYRELDQLFVEKFYGVKRPLEDFYRLAADAKTGIANGSEEGYYRHLDELFGDGKTSFEIIWRELDRYTDAIQMKISYKPGAVDFLKTLRKLQKPIALATNSNYRDIEYFSSDISATGQVLKPTEFFDKIVTFDDVQNPKPDPETFQKAIDFYAVNPQKALIFEDSLSGVRAAKASGAQLVAVHDRHSDHCREQINALADYQCVLLTDLL